MPASSRQVECVLWCQSQLLSAGLDGFIVLYDLAKLNVKTITSSVGGAIWCMTRNKSETKIAIGTEDGYIAIYEMNADGLSYEKLFNKQEGNFLPVLEMVLFTKCAYFPFPTKKVVYFRLPGTKTKKSLSLVALITYEFGIANRAR